MIILERPKNTIQKVIRGVFLGLFVMALGMVYFFSGAQPINSPPALEVSASNEALVVVLEAPPMSQPAIIIPVDDGKIHAQAAYSVDLTSGSVLFNQDGSKQLPVASLTKLMTALVVLENYNLQQKVTISAAAMAQEGVQGVLKEGQMLTVKDLLYIALMESSNRAAYALSEIMGADNFIIIMNEHAKALGLEHTHFADVSGLSSGSYSTAEDIAKLSIYLFNQYPLFNQIISTKRYSVYSPDGTLHHMLINTNQLLGQMGIVGGKTGYTEEAKGCFMAITKNAADGYIIHVILGAQDRFLEMKKLINK